MYFFLSEKKMESMEVGHIDTLTQESFLIFSKNKGKHNKNQRCKNPNFRRRSSNTENDDDDSFNNRENFCNSDIPNLQLLGINILRLFKLIYIKNYKHMYQLKAYQSCLFSFREKNGADGSGSH